MRRKDLAVTESSRIDAMIAQCPCIHLAFADANKPYVVPLNFGYRREDGVGVIYFHSAAEGRKVELARKVKYAAFVMEHDLALHTNEKACDFSMKYESIMGEGPIEELLTLDAKSDALSVIMRQVSSKEDWEFPEAVLQRTVVFRMTLKELTAKAHA